MPVALRKSASELFGVPAPARNARDRLVNKAIDLFYTQGFNAVGLDQVLDAVGVTKTTFYKHFESKDDLIVAALRQRDEWEQQAWDRAVRKLAGDDPRNQLLGFLDVLDVWFNDPDFGGCMFINAAAEFPNPNDPVHKTAAEHKIKARNHFRDLAKAAGASDAEMLADRFTMLFEGTLILRHVHHRNDAAAIARGLAEQMLDEFIPPVAVARPLTEPIRSTHPPEQRRRRKAPPPAPE